MKAINKYVGIGIVSFFVLFPFFKSFAVAPEGGPLDDLLSNVATDTVENTALKVQNLSVLPADKKVVVMWDPVSDSDDSLITKYKISYGKESVEEGLASEYTDAMKLELDADELKTVGVARSSILGLKNGEKYFFAVQAIDKDGNLGAFSDEKFATPSANVSDISSSEEGQDILFELKDAEALTKSIVKVSFSKEVSLPEEKEERGKLFTVNLKLDEDTIFEVENVVLKKNYFLKDEDKGKENVQSDKELYIILKEDLEKDVEYQITASAKLRDKDENVIESGVTDNVFFIGTDANEIPESEKLDLENTLVATDESLQPVEADPLAGLFGEEEKQDDKTTNKEEEKDVYKKDETQKNQDQEILHSAPKDTTPPEEITNLKVQLVKRIKDFLVNLTWTKSKNTAGDLVQQLLYTSVDNGKTWGTPRTFEGDLEEYSFTGVPKKVYTIKVTTKDRSGNESKGVIKTIKVPALVSSGSPLFLALGFALLLGGVFIVRRQKEF